MKIKQFFCMAALALGALIGCHKDSPGKKIIDGLPVTTAPLMIPPAQAVQEYLLLNNAMLSTVITNLNRLSLQLPATGLTGPDASLNYTFQRNEIHYGLATFVIQFQDVNSGALDPFTTGFATSSIKFVQITVNGTSTAFTFSEHLILSLDTVAILTGPYHMSGTSEFDDSSYSIIYTLNPAGVVATITGLLSGQASSVSSQTSPKTTSSSLSFGQVSDVSGVIKWEDQTAGIHVSPDGSGYLTTSDSRILFQ